MSWCANCGGYECRNPAGHNDSRLTGWRANAVKALQLARAKEPDGSMLADDIDAVLSASHLNYMRSPKGWGKASIAQAVRNMEEHLHALEYTLDTLACWDRECVENSPKMRHAHTKNGRVIHWPHPRATDLHAGHDRCEVHDFGLDAHCTCEEPR